MDIEIIWGTAFDDTFTVTSDLTSSDPDVYTTSDGTWNMLSPGAGNDTITGNDVTKLDYKLSLIHI